MSCPFHLDRLIRSGEPNDDDIKPTTLVSSSSGKYWQIFLCVCVNLASYSPSESRWAVYTLFILLFFFIYIHDFQVIYIYLRSFNKLNYICIHTFCTYYFFSALSVVHVFLDLCIYIYRERERQRYCIFHVRTYILVVDGQTCR